MDDVEQATARGSGEIPSGEPAFQEDIDREFDRLVLRWTDEHGQYDEARDYLDTLIETRAVIASLQAQEQRCLARLEAIALESAQDDASGSSDSSDSFGASGDPGAPDSLAAPNAPDAPGSPRESREIAWRSMVAEVAVATRLADRTVQTMMGTATALVHSLPATLGALDSGRISIGHARVILEHAAGIEGAARVEFEARMVPRAESTTPGKLASSAKIAAARLRAQSPDEQHATACQSRSVSIRDLDNGMSELLHVLPTPFAAAIFDRLTRQAKAVAAGPENAEDIRTRDQLRSDLATDLLLTGEPATGEGAPHTAAEGISAQVSITIPALTLLGESNEPATLTGRGPIDLDTAVRLASHAPEFTRVLTHPVTGMVVAADTYRPTAGLRRYLAARDRHCRFPTCNRDARWCDIDHTVPWEENGQTVPDNLAHLCRGHHTLKHHSRWKVRQVSPEKLEWTSPRGDTVTDAEEPQGPRFRHGPPPRHDDSPPPF